MNKMETIKVLKDNVVEIAYWLHYYESEAKDISKDEEKTMIIVTRYGSVVKRSVEEVEDAIRKNDDWNMPIMAVSLVDRSDYRLLNFGDGYKLVTYLIKFIDDLKKKAKDEIDAM